MSEVVFIDNSMNVREAISDAALAFLIEASACQRRNHLTTARALFLRYASEKNDFIPFLKVHGNIILMNQKVNQLLAVNLKMQYGMSWEQVSGLLIMMEEKHLGIFL